MKHPVELFDLYFPAALQFVAGNPALASMPAQHVATHAADIALAALDVRETLVAGGKLAYEQLGPAPRTHVAPSNNMVIPAQFAQPPQGPMPQPPGAFNAGVAPGSPGVSTSASYVPKPGEAVLESGRGYVITPGAPEVPVPGQPGQ